MENKDTTYNGWSNYETWCVNTWLTNDEGSVDYLNELADEVYKDAEKTKYATRKEKAIYELSKQIDEYISEGNPVADTATVYSDLLTAALGAVDWYEIAESVYSDFDFSEYDNEEDGE